MGKKSTSGSGMNIPDHISESLEQFFRLKYLAFLMPIRIRDPGFLSNPDPGIFLTVDPGSGMENSDPGLG
jgi:hypothetical protein